MREHHRKSPVQGIGINDADYKVTVRGNVKCKAYQLWTGILNRCYSSSFHKNNPTYAGCTISNDWIYFSKFSSWVSSQDWQGKFLDKDVLFPGNKIYSPDTCLFVTREINNFFRLHSSNRDLPVGVSKVDGVNVYVSRCYSPSNKSAETLGYFHTPEEAHAAWRARKHQIALILAEKQTDPRIANALQSRFAPAI